jgi:hypothetical protein
MRYRRNQFWQITSGLAMLAAVAMLSACGTSDSTAADSSEGVASTGTAVASPLDELFGWNESVATARDNSNAVEQFIETCMKEQGWKYQQVPFPGNDSIVALMDERRADPVAFGIAYGYAVVRENELIYEAGITGPGRRDDPNSAYVDSLSVDDRLAFGTALFGAQSAAPVDDASGAGEPKMPPIESSGCRAEAERAVYGERPTDDPAISARLSTLTAAVNDDPAMQAAFVRWTDCMTRLDPTYTWPSPDELFASLHQELDAAERAVAPVTLFGYPPDDSTPDTSTPGSVAPRPMIGAAILDELRARELRLWAADSGCAAEAGLPEARRQVEQRIADDLVAEFPQLTQP